MRFKLQVNSYNGVHVHAVLFAGSGGTLANIGSLAMREPEYLALAMTLRAGAAWAEEHVEVVVDDDAYQERKRQEEAAYE